MNMDYSICQALKYNTKGFEESVLLYDVICAWGIHFETRVKEGRFLEIPDALQLILGIGKFHLNAHKSDCFPLYSPNFIYGSGEVDGEIMETLWALINPGSAFAKHMTLAQRREYLNQLLGDINFKKMVGMGEHGYTILRIVDYVPCKQRCWWANTKRRLRVKLKATRR
jgi:hypothetical protein